MTTYYNEIDPNCCKVLRRHIDAGDLPAGVVDDRSIEDVLPEEIKDYQECHFFAGIGGFPLGFKQAGLSAKSTVWTGGFPCQDLSVAGDRKGLAGGRSGLYFHFHRLIAADRPDLVILENVPGLLSSNEGKDFAIIIGGLTGIVPEVPLDGWGNAGAFRGEVYQVAYRILDAQFFGVPQQRRRVFIVGSLGDGRCAEILFESESGTGHFASGRKARQAIASTVGGNPPSRRNGGSNPTEGHFVAESFTVRGGEGKGGKGYLSNGDKSQALSGQHNYITKTLRSRSSNPGVNEPDRGGEDDQNLVVESPDVAKPIGGGDGSAAGALAAEPGMKQQNYVSLSLNAHPTGRYDPSEETFLITASGQANAETVKDGSPSLTGLHEQPIVWEMAHADEAVREARSGVTPTLQERSGTGGNQVPMIGVRRLTPTEYERLQGFPDGWTAGQADSPRYRQGGNAVAEPVIEWLGNRIKMISEGEE